jgi:hypothetical protein
MTTLINPEPHTVQISSPPGGNPQLDERLWEAWKENNKKRDKVRSARLLKGAAIPVVVAALAASVLQLSRWFIK